MKAKDLKNSILQMAVEGKLVSQNPSDEPASVLLDRIREERHKLIAEGKAKFPKGGESIIYTGSDGRPYEKRVDAKGHESEPVCIEDEIPFEIPESWMWTRMESVLEFINGRAYKKTELLASGKYPVLRVGNLFTNSTWYYSDLDLDSDKYCHNGDLLYAWSASFGPTIWSGPDCIFHYHIWNVKHSKLLNRQYLYWALLQDVVRVKTATTGSTMIHVSMEHMKPRLLPVPPLAEQRRIVEKINELMPLVEEYGRLEDDREELDAALPDRLRKSVLQMAVQGKLVPQNPSDEPASALLERIRGQRRELVKQKKMKAPKGGESIIYTGSDGRRYEKRVDAKGHESEPVCIEDEIPFDIPDSWEWARFTNIVSVQYGFPADSQKFTENGSIGLIRIRDVNSGDLIHTSIDYDGEWDPQYLIHSGDDLIGMDGEFNCLRWKGEKALLNQRVCCLKYYPGSMNRDYVRYAMNWYLQRIWESTSKTTVKHLSAKALDSLLFAVPPIEVQERIAKCAIAFERSCN